MSNEENVRKAAEMFRMAIAAVAGILSREVDAFIELPCDEHTYGDRSARLAAIVRECDALQHAAIAALGYDPRHR